MISKNQSVSVITDPLKTMSLKQQEHASFYAFDVSKKDTNPPTVHGQAKT